MPRPLARRATTTTTTTTSSTANNNNSDNKDNNKEIQKHINNEILNARCNNPTKTDPHRYNYEGHTGTKNGTTATTSTNEPPLNVSAISNKLIRQGLSANSTVIEKKSASTCLSTQSLDTTNRHILSARGISLTTTKSPPDTAHLSTTAASPSPLYHSRPSTTALPPPPTGPTNLLHICCSDDNSSPYLLQIYLHREPRLALSYDENGYLPLHHAILSHNVEKTSLLLQAQPETVEARAGLSDSTLSLAYKSLRRDDPRGGVIINLLERLRAEGRETASAGVKGLLEGQFWIPQINSMGHGYLYQQLMNSRYSIETSRQQLNDSLNNVSRMSLEQRQEFDEEIDEDDDSVECVEVVTSSSNVIKPTVATRVYNDDDDEDKGVTHDSKPSTVISPTSDSSPPKVTPLKDNQSVAVSIPPMPAAAPTSGSHLMKMCSDNKWAELNAHITQNPSSITSILTHYKTNIEDIRDDDCQTTTILHRVLRSRSTDLCGRVTVINTILQSPYAADACAIRSKPLGALPLHVALHRDNKMDTATREQVIAALVKVYPEATIAQTSGKTPLHIMSRQYSSTAIAKMLITACPAAAKIRDDTGWLPIHHACRWRSSPEKLKLLIDAYPGSVFLKTEYEGLKPMDLILANATKTRPHLALISMLKESMEALERNGKPVETEKQKEEIRTIVVTADSAPSKSPTPQATVASPPKKKPSTPPKKSPPPSSSNPIPLIHVKKVTSDDKALLALCKANDWHSVEKHIQLHPHSATSVLRDRNSNGTTVLHKVFASSSTDYASRIQVIDRSLQIAPQLAAVKNGCGSLPLHLAARNSYKIQIDTKTQEDVIKSLIRVYPSAAVTQNAAGRTPLHIACAHFCSSGVLRLLLNAGKEAASKQDRQGCLPIHLACRRSCSVDKLELLLEAYPESVLVKSKAGLTPLCVALMDFSNNPRQSSRFILTLKGKLDYINKKKQKDGEVVAPAEPAASVTATATATTSTVKLIHYDHNTKDKTKPVDATTSARTTASSPTPLTDTDMEAAATIKFLRSSSSPPTTPPPSPPIDVVTCNLNACVLSICRANAWKEVEEFIQIANPSLDEMGTILHHVLKTKKGSLRERTDLISFLLARNPDAALVKSSHTGSLPLHIALGKSNGMDEHMRRHVVSLLISHHPSAIAVQEREKGRTPLHAAFINRYSTSTVKLMLDANPKAVKIKDSGGWLPIHHACKRSCPSEQLELLIELYPKSLGELTDAGESLSDLAINFAKDGSARLALLKESEKQFIDGVKGDKKRGEEEMTTEEGGDDGKMTPMKRAPSGGWTESAPPLKKRKCGIVAQESA